MRISFALFSFHHRCTTDRLRQLWDGQAGMVEQTKVLNVHWTFVSLSSSCSRMISNVWHGSLLGYTQESQGYWALLRAFMILSWLPSTPKYVLLKATRRIARVSRHHLPQAALILSNTRFSTCSSVLQQVWWCIYTIYVPACLQTASRSLLSLEPNGGSRLHSIAFQQPCHTFPPNGGTLGHFGGMDSLRHQQFPKNFSCMYWFCTQR